MSKKFLRENFEVINREVEIAVGISTSELTFCLFFSLVVYVLTQKFNLAVVAGGIAFYVVSRLKKELGSVSRVAGFFEYVVRPKRYGRKRI
jgi:hypothetical protein